MPRPLCVCVVCVSQRNGFDYIVGSSHVPINGLAVRIGSQSRDVRGHDTAQDHVLGVPRAVAVAAVVTF
jgi:hypothetical protein